MVKLITVHWPCFFFKGLGDRLRQSGAQDRAFIGFVLSHLATMDISAFFLEQLYKMSSATYYNYSNYFN